MEHCQLTRQRHVRAMAVQTEQAEAVAARIHEQEGTT